MNTSTSDQFASDIAACLAPIDSINGKKLKLILHVGTPKTGTTSLQVYLEKKQGKLRRKGILYPNNIANITNPTAPKHQWFERNLLSTHVDFFTENFKNIVSQVDDNTHTIILSSEGIYNRWWDFPEKSKDLLKALDKLFRVEVWVWFREPCEFIESFYKQCVRNPCLVDNPCYGKDMSFSQMMDIDWFTKHLDYRGFADQCKTIFTDGTIKAYEYNADVVQSVSQKFGLATVHDNPTPRLNSSLTGAAVSVLRAINQFDIKPKDKERMMPYIREMNSILSTYERPSLIDSESRKRVLEMVRYVNYDDI